MAASCSVVDGRFVLDFPYSRPLVDAVRLIPGRRFDGDRKVWTAPAESWQHVDRFCARFRVPVGVDAAAVIGERSAGPVTVEYHVFVDDDTQRLVYRAGYVKDIVAACRTIDGRRWHPETAAWSFPAREADHVRDMVERFGLTVHPAAMPTLNAWAANAEEMRTLSRATEAFVEVPGLADGLALRPFQMAGVLYAQKADYRVLIADEMGVGKLQPVDAPVLTPTGWCPIGDLTVGDRVIGSDGRPTTVRGVFPQGRMEIVRVCFADGAVVECGWDHLWTVDVGGVRRTVTTRDIYAGTEFTHMAATGAGLRACRSYTWSAGLRDRSGYRRLRTPNLPPVVFDPVDLPIDPYLLGVILGDGHIAPAGYTSVTLNDVDADEICATAGLAPGRYNGMGGRTVNVSGVAAYMRSVGLAGKRSWEKFVPDPYLRGSPEQRLALLRGLMDTDGHGGSASTEFSTTSPALADAVVDLARSLGGVARTRTRVTHYTHNGERRDGRRSWRVNLKLPVGVNPFTVSRKVGMYRAPTKYGPVRIIDRIEVTGDERDAVCIRVANRDGLYVTSGYIVTHNTLEAMSAVVLADRFPCVVACPPIATINWQREIRRFFPGRRAVIVEGQTPRPIDPTDFIIVGYSVLAYWAASLLSVGVQSLIYDESDMLRNPRARRTIAAKMLAGVGTRDNPRTKLTGCVPPDGPKILTTGTPIRNDTTELVTQLAIMGRLDDMGGYKGFTDRYVKLRGVDTTNPDAVAERRRELHERLRSTAYIRRRKADVLAELPAKTRQFFWVRGEPRIMREYDRAETALLDYLADRARAEARKIGADPESAATMARMRASGAEHLVRISVLREIAARSKIPAATEWAHEFLATGGALGIYAHHRTVVTAMADATGSATIIGGMNKRARQRVIDDFQAGRVRSAVLSITAAGVAITLTAASTGLFIEQAWNPGTLAQAEDRHHRQGQVDAVNIVYFLAEGTIDADIADLLESKRVEVDGVLDGGDVESWDASRSDGDPDAHGSIVGDLIERLTQRALARTTNVASTDVPVVDGAGQHELALVV